MFNLDSITNENTIITQFIQRSNTMNDVYDNIDDYNLNRKKKTLIVFDGMIADIMTSKTIY